MAASKTTAATITALLLSSQSVIVNAQRLRQSLRGIATQSQAQQEEKKAPSCEVFHVELQTDDSPCEISWLLERLADDNTNGDDDFHDDDVEMYGSLLDTEEEDGATYLYVDSHEGDYFDLSDTGSSERCLESGRYRFTIYDAYGDGLLSPGYYNVVLDGVVLGGGSGFGYEEITEFTVDIGGSSQVLESSATGSSVEEEEVMVMDPAVALEEDEVVTVEDESHPMNLEVVSSARATSQDEPDSMTTIESASAASTDTQVEAISPIDENDESEIPSVVITPSNELELSEKPSSADTFTTESTQEDSQQWMELLNEDFEHDLGHFHPGSSKDAEFITYYPLVKERKGVVRLQNNIEDTDSKSSMNKAMSSSNIYSDNIAIDTQSYNEIKLNFSFYANSMEQLHNDGFCVDYSIDNGSSWHSKQCWHAIQDFDNNVWYDDMDVTFNALNDHHLYSNDVAGIRLRFRCKTNSVNDDVLLDKVQLFGLVRQTHVKDSI